MMNRSFRGSETLTPSIKPRITTQLKSFQSSFNGVRDKEDDLALFLEMRRLENDHTRLLNHHSDEFNEGLVSQPGISPLFDISAAKPVRKFGGDDFLNSDGDKNDYDWLLTPPGTPLFPSLEMESKKTYKSEAEAPKGQPAALRSRLANSQAESTAKSSLRQSTGSAVLNPSASGMRRPSSSNGPGSRPVTPGGPGSRPATPTGRSTSLSTKSSRPSTPTSRATLSGAKPTVHSSSPKPPAKLTSSRPIGSTSSKSTASSRSSTPSRSVARPSASSTGPSKSSTPTRATPRLSTPTRTTANAKSSTPTASRATVSASRPTSRASTPTRRLSAPSSGPNVTTALNKSSSSISSKSVSVPSKNLGPSHGASPAVRSRAWNPSAMPGFSLDAPPNLRTILPDRPLSATRGRAAAAARSSSVEPISNGRQRRQSCSPSRGGVPSRISGSSVPAGSRGHLKVSDDVSPVVMGTKMVERVVNMRKLVPPRHDEKHSPGLSGKSASSPDSSGFGLTLSKKSLDMAIRHMDIRRSIPGNLRPLMTKIPAPSMYSVRTGPTGSRTASVSDSPVATSSNASSEQSVNNHVATDGHGIESDDDFINERVAQISPSLLGR